MLSDARIWCQRHADDKLAKMHPRDTSAQAHAIQMAILRSFTPAQRFQAAVEMSDFTHKLAVAGLRMRRPDCTDANVNRLLAESLFPQKRRNR